MKNTMTTNSIKAAEGETIIRIGKINCVITERFAPSGKAVDEILEKLIIEKCRLSA